MTEQNSELSIPGLTGKATNKQIDFTKYRIRYFQADLSDPSAINTLEDLETRGLAADDIILLGKDKYSFKENFYVVLCYAERRE